MKQWEKYLNRIPKKDKLVLLEGLKMITTGNTATLQIKKMVDRKNTYRRKPNRNLRVEYILIDGIVSIIKI